MPTDLQAKEIIFQLVLEYVSVFTRVKSSIASYRHLWLCCSSHLELIVSLVRPCSYNFREKSKTQSVIKHGNSPILCRLHSALSKEPQAI